MPQLNLNFNEIPIPETHLWEQFADEQKRGVIERIPFNETRERDGRRRDCP